MFKISTVQCVIVFLKILCCYASMDNYSHLHLYEGFDFLVVVSTSLFVDKSLLIKCIMNTTKSGDGILILTPKNFGKSTSLNMMKRFFAVNVDEHGTVKSIEETSNYNMFRNNNLEIFKSKYFFKKHFGKYPVVSIDYKQLTGMFRDDDLIKTLKLIFFNTFRQHSYLERENNQWSEQIGTRRISRLFELDTQEETLNEFLEEIKEDFHTLCYFLEKRFRKRVIVLMDNYDAFVDSPLFARCPNISSVFRDISWNLLRCASVERSVVTGLFRGSEQSVSVGTLLPTNIGTARQLGAYFGLSGPELEGLLRRVISDAGARKRAFAAIIHSYREINSISGGTTDVNNAGIVGDQICFASVVSHLKGEESNMYPVYEEYDFK